MKSKSLISTALISLLFVVGTVQANPAVISLTTNSQNDVIVTVNTGPCTAGAGTYTINQKFQPYILSDTNCQFTVTYGTTSANQVCANGTAVSPSFTVNVKSTNGSLSCNVTKGIS